MKVASELVAAGKKTRLSRQNRRQVGATAVATESHPPGRYAGLIFPALLALGVSSQALAISQTECSNMGAACVQVGTLGELQTALGNTSTATTILLTNDIVIGVNGIVVNQAAQGRQNLVIDGGGHNLTYNNQAFVLAAATTNNAAWAGENASLQLVHFGDISSTLATTGTATSRLVLAGDATTRISLLVDDIGSIPDGTIAALGQHSAGAAENPASRMVLGNINSPAALTMNTFRQSVVPATSLSRVIFISPQHPA